MKLDKIINILRLFSAIILIDLILVMHAVALEVETHKAINIYIADEASITYGSYLHSYLKSNLGMQDGVKTMFVSKMAKEWVADGGEYEDNFLRYSNHFYNPLNNKGLSGIFISAKDWALRPMGNQYADGQYSWFDVRDYYYKALTSTDKATRETNFAETFRGIGQVMHLVQDISVPAHTSNKQLTYCLEV